MNRLIKFIEKFLFAVGTGIFVSGIIILNQTNWTNWLLAIAGFSILVISTIIEARN